MIETPEIAIAGAGAVSPAGWGCAPFLEALRRGDALGCEPFALPGAGGSRMRRRPVPKPVQKLPFLRDPRLRRASPVGRFLAAAASEALASSRLDSSGRRLAVISTCFTGCVNYSARFFGEVLDDPATASPILFPETVFNAPASHLAALFGSDEVNHTLVGDESAFASALDMAAAWLIDGAADAVLVVAGEESDPLTAEAKCLLEGGGVVGEGAGALLLERTAGDAEAAVLLDAVGEVEAYSKQRGRGGTAANDGGDRADGQHAVVDTGAIEAVFGDAFGANPAWAAVAAWAAVHSGRERGVTIPLVGRNAGAGWARFAARPR